MLASINNLAIFGFTIRIDTPGTIKMPLQVFTSFPWVSRALEKGSKETGKQTDF